MKDNKKWCVYMHTNKTNEKKYIGISSDVKKRWRSNGYPYYDQVFGNAIKKYGWDNFIHEIIADNLSKEDACSMEQELIMKYQTYKKEFGYNRSMGGASGSFGSYNTQKKRMVQVYQYDMDGNFIKKHISIASAVRELRPDLNTYDSCNIPTCCKGERLSALGYRWFYEYKGEKIEPILSPRERIAQSKRKEVYQYSLDGNYIQKYKSVSEAEKEFGMTGISSCINKRVNCMFGYQWFDEYMGNSVNPVKTAKRIPVFQYNANGDYIRSFSSMSEAAKYVHMRIIHLYDIETKKIYPDGFIWLKEYKGEKLSDEYL